MMLALLIALAIVIPALFVGIEYVGYWILGGKVFDEFKWSEYRGVNEDSKEVRGE